MLSTIFKYLWLVPLVILYIIWTIKAVKALIRLIVDRRKYGKVSYLSDDYSALFVWVIVHMILMFVASFVYFIAGG